VKNNSFHRLREVLVNEALFVHEAQVNVRLVVLVVQAERDSLQICRRLLAELFGDGAFLEDVCRTELRYSENGNAMDQAVK
jgi:hypothetical protein